MKNIYKQHLFAKHILVKDCGNADNPVEALFALANLFGINVVKGKQYACEPLIKFVASELGIYVPRPFYQGFPDTVRALSKEELLFDQIIHYFDTYVCGNFDGEAAHSLFEGDFKRAAFKEEVAVKDFVILTEKEAVVELGVCVNNLLASTRPLSYSQYEFVAEALADYHFDVQDCPCKDTAIRFIYDKKEMNFVKFLHLSDFVKVVEAFNYYGYKSTNPKKLNFKNSDRKFLAKILDALLERDADDYRSCYEKRQAWCGILHHLHYKPKTDAAREFVEAMRDGKNESVYSVFEKMMEAGDVCGATEYLIQHKGKTMLLRSLNYILSRCKTEQEISFVMDRVGSKNNIVIIQMLMQYHHYRAVEARHFKFTRFNRLIVHTETEKERQDRKSVISADMVEKIRAVLYQRLQKNLQGKLGKVYVAEGMKKIALPMQENTSLGGFGALPKGSREALPEGKKVRAFTYWEKVNDIDLSLIGLANDGSQVEFSWRTMYSAQSKEITFSGDQTRGYNGGSEYFDLDLPLLKKKYPDCRYYVLCDNVFSRIPFNQCFCKAGYMMRDTQDSGEVFEPKTVKSSLRIDCDSTFAYLLAVDVEKNEIVWLNVARESDAIVAGATGLAFLLDYLDATEVINLHAFFTMLATEVVDDPALADVVVTDEDVKTKEGAVIVRSYDYDKILPLLND